jgi:hypothetical protein
MKKPRLYVTGAKGPAEAAAWRTLRDAGAPIVASWIDPDTGPVTLATLQEETQCDALLLDLSGSTLAPEAFFEVGMALTSGASLFVVTDLDKDALARRLGAWVNGPSVYLRSTREVALAEASEEVASGERALGSAFSALSTWLSAHRTHAVRIEHPNRLGPACWTVTLIHAGRETIAEEVSFWTLPEEKGGWVGAVQAAANQGVVFATKTEDETFPGLAATIRAAIAGVRAGTSRVRP